MKRSLFVSAVTALAFTATALASTFGGFAQEVVSHVGNYPRQVRAADFNGDGLLDLASCNSDANDISVLIGHGDGTFDAAVSYPVGASPLSISAGDLDGDGDIDLSIANGNGDSISVYFGNGDGTFTLHQTYAFDPESPPYPNVIMVHTMADFDGDGDLDIAVLTLTGTAVIILPNDGTGTFGPYQVADEPPGAFPSDMEAGDFNGDGNMDLILARGYFGGHGPARVLLNNGDGTWVASEFDAEADGIVSPPADFDGDGILDLALTRTIDPGGYMLVTLGNGDGTFGPQTSYPVNRPYAPTTVDLDGDGNIDLVVPNYGTYKTISVMFGNGDGTFEDPLLVPLAKGNAWAVIAADIDNDTWPDIVCVHSGSNGNGYVGVLMNLTEYSQGDLNCDGAVNNQDIDPFVLALFDAAGYATQYPNCDILNGDFTGDGYVNNQDIDGFVAALFGA